MSFYPPGAAFPAVAAVVNYRPPLPAAAAAAAAAAAGAVPLPQPLVAPLPVPVPVLEPPPQRAKADVPPGGPSPFAAGPTASSAGAPDPVTKAVMDNIMGKLPTKKQPTSCKCEVCGLEFSGQVVLETHLAGAKHAKKVKSQEILRQLQSSGQTFSRDEKTKILKCEVCDVVVNSSQQLQTHLAGNKHKQKVLKKAAQGGVGVAKNAINMNSANALGADVKGDGASPGAPTAPAAATTAAAAAALAAPTPMDASPAPTPMPAGDAGPKKMEGVVAGGGAAAAPGLNAAPAPPPALAAPQAQAQAQAQALRASKYFCDTCNVSLNSEIQLEQHLGSRKHKERLANGGKTRPRPAPYWKKPRGAGFGGGGGGGGKRAGVGAAAAAAGGGKLPGPSLPYTQPLSSTFVSGGSMM